MYTERFTEAHALLGTIAIAAHVGGNSTAWIHLQNYHRVVGILFCGNVAGTVDAAFYQATDEHGTGVKAVTGKSITQLGATDDDALCAIELRTEELDVVGGFDWVRLSCESSNVSTVYGAAVLGVVDRFAPADTTAWTEVVD
jgi:hypothetical protein